MAQSVLLHYALDEQPASATHCIVLESKDGYEDEKDEAQQAQKPLMEA